MGRSIVFAVLLLCISFFPILNSAAVLPNAPHDPVQNITCADCHANALPATNRSANCTTVTCHGVGSALPHLDHSDFVMSGGATSNWSTECLDCHDPHFHAQQDRVSTNFNELYLFTGRIPVDDVDAVTPQATTTDIKYTNLIINDSNWSNPWKWGEKNGVGRGLILVRNADDPQETFEIVSAIETPIGSGTGIITVNGVMSAEVIAKITHYSSRLIPFGAIYGQFIDTTVNGKDVAFYGTTSFANNDGLAGGEDSTPDGICQACHISTLYWLADGTLSTGHHSGVQCSRCHEPENGFKAGCDSCHGGSNSQPPGMAVVNFNDGGAHERHSSNATDWSHSSWPREYSCTMCHQNTVGGTGPESYTIDTPANHENTFMDWEFDTSDPRLYAAENPSYSVATGIQPPSDGTTFGTCSNIYCHSTVQPDGGIGPPDVYDAGTVLMGWGSDQGHTSLYYCIGCHNQSGSGHGTGIQTGGHASDDDSYLTHDNYSFGLPGGVRKCAICHKWNPAASRTSCANQCHDADEKQYHVNGSVDVIFDSFASETASYAGTPSPGDGYANCLNTYCHSDGTSVASETIPVNATPLWGSGALVCTDCHSYPPQYVNGIPKANSHQSHSYLKCESCHFNVTVLVDTVDIINPQTHVNNAYDLEGDFQGGGLVTFDYAYSPAGGTCSNLICHGDNNATWGGPPIGCADCHMGVGDVDDYDFANGIPAQIDLSEWNLNGHGMNGILDGLGSDACLYCHLQMVNHHTTAGTNPFKLANVSGSTMPDNCLICHGTGSSGFDPDGGGGPLAVKNSTVKIDSYHYGTDHSVIANGGLFCWDCHDPHGDANNSRMIQDEVTKQSTDQSGIPVDRVPAIFNYADSQNPAGTDYASFSQPYNRICNVCHINTDIFTSTSGAGVSGLVDHSDPSFETTACVDCHSHNGSPPAGGFGSPP